MNKRQKVFHDMCVKAGVKIIDWGGAPAGRVGGIVEAPNGKTGRFSISSSKPGEAHSDLNSFSDMRRWVRENPATALSGALKPVASLIATAPLPNKKPRAILRVIQQPMAPRAPTPAPIPSPAPVAAPVPPPAPVAAPAMIHQPPQDLMATTAANDPKASGKRASSVRMTRFDFHKLTKHIESIDVTSFDTMSELAASCAKTLAIVATTTHVNDALEVLGITHFKRVRASAAATAEDGKLALELARATAVQFMSMCAALGTSPDADYLRLVADKHGINPRAVAQKAA